jgi:oxygen-independent coproporphyrinogen-3 oxidase
MKRYRECDECNFFATTSEFLASCGYIHYEVSSYSRGEAFYSRHNRKYWFGVPYLGLGPSAHSFSGDERWWNVGSLREYCTLVEYGVHPLQGKEKLTDEQRLLETVALGLRTNEGFPTRAIPANLLAPGAISRLEELGYLRLSNGRAVPTEKGLLLADQLPLVILR